MKVYTLRSVRIYYEEDAVTENAFFVTGFKGYGLVGYITTLYITEKLDCNRFGVVVTRYMPEAVSFDRGRVVAPFELLSCLNGRLVVLLNHDVPHERERTMFAEAITRWVRDVGVSEEILVGGFDSRFRSGSEELRWIATSASRRRLKEPVMEKGLYVVGPLALLTLYAEIYGVPALVILPYTEAARPDPRAAAVAVRRVAEIVGFSIDVSDLLEEAKKVEELIAAMEKQREAAAKGGEAERVYM